MVTRKRRKIMADGDRPTPALDAAVAHLRRLVSGAARSGQGRLPPLRAIAAAAGVSYVTASRALAYLTREGVLSARPGQGIAVPAARPALGAQSAATPSRASAPQGRPVRRALRWNSLADRLEQEILQGRHDNAASLPSLKELAAAHAANYRTVRKALDRLAERRIVEPYHRTCRVCRHPARRGRGTVVLVARANTGGRQQVFDARTANQLRVLEGQCAQVGVDLQTAPVVYRGEQLAAADGAPGFGDIVRERTVLGFVAWTMGMSLPAALDLERRLSEHGKPVAMLDEDDTLHGVRLAGARARLFVSAGTATCGMHVGQYLRRLGHHNVAYVTVFAQDRWSRNRLAGLREAYGNDSAAVQEFTAPSVDAALADSDEVSRLLVALRRSGAAPVAAQPARSMSAALAEEQVTAMVRRRMLHEHLWPALKAASREAALTAWVGANDDVALQCLEFLRSRSVDVPGRMSVVGFDDTFDATYWQMTSYSFDTSAVVHSMLAHVLRPDLSAGGERAQPSNETPGFVVARQTSGPARR
jgi:DNA-binding transcriptional regulator YhcF (GntR family)